MKSRLTRKLMKAGSVLLCAALLSQPVFMLNAGAAEEGKTIPVISVDAFTDRDAFNRNIVSANHRFNSNGYGMYDAENGEVHEDFVNKTSEVGYGLIRYPAGTIGNLFKWKDSIGPVEERKSVVLANRQRLNEVPIYGLDDHMTYVEQIGAGAIIMVAEASETPEDAADLVEYLNSPNDGSNPNGGVDWAAVRAENGHPEPYGVTYFEIGNEMSSADQRYWLDYTSATGKQTYQEKYSLGDTVDIKNEPARIYGTWIDNESRGTANQEFYSQYYPVVTDSQEIFVGGVTWTEVDSFEGCDGNAQVYMFDETIGKITFGDGVNGKIPSQGQKIRMDYQHIHAGFEAYYDAMKAVDPNIKVVSCIEKVYDYIEDKSKCDGIVKHNYPVLGGASDARGLHDNYINRADGLINSFVNDDAAVKTAAGRNDAILATTEYGIIPIPHVFSDPDDDLHRDEARMLSRGLHFATILIAAAQMEKELLIHQGFTAYSFGGGAGLGSAGSVYNALYAQDPNNPEITIESAMGLAYKMFGQGHGEIVLNSFVENNPIIDSKNSGDYNALRVLASKDENGDMYLFVVNRDPENDVTAAVNLNGYEMSGNAEISILNAESYASCNTPEHPEDVYITKSTAVFESGKGSFAYTFPAHSVVSIKLNGKVNEIDPWVNTFETENFEDTDFDAMPSMMAVTSQTAGVVADPLNNENKVLAITRNANGKATVKASLSGETATGALTEFDRGVRISYKFMATAETARMNMQVKAGNTTVMNLAYDNGMLMCNGTRRQFLSQNEWHEIEFVLDHAAREYMMYVDGEYAHSARTYNNTPASGIDSIVFDVENTNATFYLDDFTVRTITENSDEIGVMDINIQTEIGVAPVLPEKVTVFNSNGTSSQVNVTWEDVTPEMYAEIGTFTVKGTAGDYEVTAVINVIKPIKTPEELGLTVKNVYIYGIEAGQTAGDYEDLSFANKGVPLKTDELIYTGCTVISGDNSYTAIILGDVNGDGKINSTDFMQIRRAFLELYEMTTLQTYAADVNGDRNINSTDFMRVRRHFLGIYNLYG